MNIPKPVARFAGSHLQHCRSATGLGDSYTTRFFQVSLIPTGVLGIYWQVEFVVCSVP